MAISQSVIEIIAHRAFELGIRYAVVGHDSGETQDEAEASIAAMVRDELEKANAPLQRKRRAFVNSRHAQGSLDLDVILQTVQRYLPANFEARIFADATLGDVILIEGYDRAGWTLDNYVIPRLASGLIVAKEVK